MDKLAALTRMDEETNASFRIELCVRMWKNRDVWTSHDW